MPTLVQLEYIVAVADTQHFGKAAKACHVSQPTLSQQIKKVEELIGIEIFDREKKPVKATKEGEAFIQHARMLLREHKHLRELFKENSNEVAGEYRLGIIPTLSNTLIPQFIDSFAEKYPKVLLRIDELQTQTIIKQLEEDRLDGAILATPLGVTGLNEFPLFYEPFLVYASKNHRLLKKQSCHVDDLDASDLWQLQDGHCFKDQIAQICSLNESDEKSRPLIQFQGGNLDTLMRLVQKGHGYTLIPALMAHQMSSSEINNHVRKFQRPSPAREISFVTRRSEWKKRLANAIKDTVIGTLPKEIPLNRNKEISVLEICPVEE